MIENPIHRTKYISKGLQIESHFPIGISQQQKSNLMYKIKATTTVQDKKEIIKQYICFT